MANNQIPISISASGDTIIIPAIAGQVIQVYGIILSLATDTTVAFRSGVAGTYLAGPQTMDRLLLDKTPGDPWYITGRGEPFVISLGDAVQCGGTVYWQPA